MYIYEAQFSRKLSHIYIIIMVRRCQHKSSPKQDTGQTSMGQMNNHLSSDLHRPVGSRVDGTLAATSDLCMMALIAACLEK